ncbi:hypothetical protein C0J50_3169, partial [Silurus asotus]
SMTKEKGNSVYIRCEVTGLGTDYVHWYQKKEDEAFKRILYARKNSKPVPETNHPDVKDFDVLTQNNNYDLKITNLKKRHSGVYYCASWDSTTVTVIIHSVYKNPDEAVLGLLLEQKDLSITKEEGKSVYISCNVTGLSSEYLHWYQKKEDEALIRILYVKRNSKPAHDNNLPDAKDFDTSIQNDNYDLKIPYVKKSHSGVYYCASWD